MKDMGEAEENYDKIKKKKSFMKDKKKSKLKCCPVFCLNLRMRCPRKLKCKCLRMNEKEKI